MVTATLHRPPPRMESEEFRALYEAEVDYVLQVIQRLGVRGSDAEDLAHDVFVTALRRFDAYDRTRAVRPWLFGIAFRSASAYRNRSRHAAEVSQPAPEQADPAAGPDARLSAAETQRDVLRALEEIDWNQRAVFIMHDIDGHSVPEIADNLGIPLNTAYTRLRTARHKFTAAYRAVVALRGAP